MLSVKRPSTVIPQRKGYFCDAGWVPSGPGRAQRSPGPRGTHPGALFPDLRAQHNTHQASLVLPTPHRTHARRSATLREKVRAQPSPALSGFRKSLAKSALAACHMHAIAHSSRPFTAHLRARGLSASPAHPRLTIRSRLSQCCEDCATTLRGLCNAQHEG